MSSRSLAAARSRRAGENAPPVSGNRPGTSIGSHAAFANQPPGYQPQMPMPSPNVRVAKAPQQPQYQQQQYYQQQPPQPQPQPSLPFSKLSISDAIGLITLRLGRVEQWIIESERENGQNNSGEHFKLPENSKIIDNSVFSSIINRLELVEKKEPGTDVGSEQITKLSEDVAKLNETFSKICEQGDKQALSIAKHTEQLFKFERDLVETKDILKTFMIKYDMFTADTNNKFSDYELALSELEKTIMPATEIIAENIDSKLSGNNDENINSIMSVDLKNIIKQELASESH